MCVGNNMFTGPSKCGFARLRQAPSCNTGSDAVLRDCSVYVLLWGHSNLQEVLGLGISLVQKHWRSSASPCCRFSFISY